MENDHPKTFTSSLKQWRKLKPLSRDMRHDPTPAEAALWTLVRNRQVVGLKFRRQHAIDDFIVDFICLDRALIVEVDGSIHDQPEQAEYDTQRQAHLEGLGYQVLRFKNAEVLKTPERVTAQIKAAVES